MNQALTSHIALKLVCVCFRVLIGSVFMRVFRQAATADPQAPAGPFSGRQRAARQSDWQKTGKRVSE